MFAWTKKIFKIKKKKITEFFSRHFKKNFIGPYKKFPTLVKNFKNFKSRVSWVKHIFFVFLFLYPGWIPLKLMESACKKKLTTLPRSSTPPTEWRNWTVYYSNNVLFGLLVLHYHSGFIRPCPFINCDCAVPHQIINVRSMYNVQALRIFCMCYSEAICTC